MGSERIEPRKRQVLIRPSKDSLRGSDLKTELTNKRLIIAPDIATEKARTGRVLAVGPQVESVRPGDMVLFRRYAGLEFSVEHGDRPEWEGLRLMPEEELLTKIYEN